MNGIPHTVETWHGATYHGRAGGCPTYSGSNSLSGQLVFWFLRMFSKRQTGEANSDKRQATKDKNGFHILLLSLFSDALRDASAALMKLPEQVATSGTAGGINAAVRLKVPARCKVFPEHLI